MLRQQGVSQSLPLIALAALVPAALFAQTAKPAQTPRTPPNAPRAQSAAPVPVIRAYSNIVVIDVVVTDSQGNPVKDLPASAFTLTEDKTPQTVRHFEEHDASPAGTQVIAPPRLPPGLFSNQPPAPENGPMNVLLLDFLNTPLTSQPRMQDQLVEYLNKAPAGTRIAIFGLSDRLYLLQGFTSDMGVLKAALSGKKHGGVNVVSNPTQGGVTDDHSLSSNVAGRMGGATVGDQMQFSDEGQQAVYDAVQRFEASRNADLQRMQALYTLNAFDDLARYLVAIPGRKNVLWFSAGFPLDVQPDVDSNTDPNMSVVRNDDEVRKTDNLLTQAQIAVYPIDSRAITVPMAPIDGSTPDTPDAMRRILQQQGENRLTMEAMAEDTGGKAYYNTNDLTAAIRSAVSNGSNYYTLTYSPTNKVWDERFRSIKITVTDQPKLKLAYREGYYAIDPNNKNQVAAKGSATALVQPTTMATAMLHGGPSQSEILFKVRVRPSDTPPSPTVLASNQSNPNPRVKVEPPFKAYGVDMVPDAKALSCNEGADGNRHCALEVWTFVYNNDGEKLITASNRMHRLLSPADYAKLLAGGMAFHQEVSVPVKGQYFLRMAIHDLNSDRVGAVEIPVGAVAGLDPLKSVASLATPAPTEPIPLPASAWPDAAGPASPPPATPATAPAATTPSGTSVPIGPPEPTMPAKPR